MTNRLSACAFLIAALSVAALCIVGCGKHAEQVTPKPSADAVPQPASDLPMPQPAEDDPRGPATSVPDISATDVPQQVEEALRKLPEKDRAKARERILETAMASVAIPPGPLTDTKYLAITTKLSMVSMLLPEEERTAKRVDGILQEILKQSGVTTAQFEKYTAQIAKDPDRKARLGKAMEQLKESGWARKEPVSESGDPP